MTTHTTSTLAAGVLMLGLAIGCSSERAAEGPDNHPVAFVDADGSHRSAVRDTLRNPFPHLLMADGRTSANDRCPVRKVPLNKRLPTLFVNGRAIGFC